MEDDGATPSMPARMIIAEGGDVEAGKERWKSILKWREENHVVECFFCFSCHILYKSIFASHF